MLVPNRFQPKDGANLSVYLLIVFGPIFMLGAMAFNGDPVWLALAIPGQRRFGLLLQSLSLSVVVALGGMLLGILVGVQLLNWSGKRLRLLRWFLFLLVPLPPYIHALAWNAFADVVNQLLRNWGLAPLVMRGWGASCWVWIMALAPLAVSLILIGLDSVDRELVEAARLQQDDRQVLARVILPLARPYIFTAGGLLFILSFIDYSIPSLFQMNSYAMDIFADFSAHHQPGRAFWLSLPILLICFGVLGLLQRPLRSAALNPTWQRNRLSQNWRWPVWQSGFMQAGMVVMLLQISIPIISLLFLTNSWQGFASNIVSAGEEIRFSLLVSTLSALACLPIAMGAAQKLSQQASWFWYLVVTLPLAIPAPLTGIGLISLWNRDISAMVYNSWWMPILASLARFTPVTVLILTAQFRRINPELIEAAELVQPSRWLKLFWIRLPMLGPGLLAGALITFILSLGELGATLLILPAGSSTITLRIYNYLHYGASDTVASLCLMITVLSLAFGLLTVVILEAARKRSTQT